LSEICDSYAIANAELNEKLSALEEENAKLKEKCKIFDESNF
jgi:hypothetical protein